MILQFYFHLIIFSCLLVLFLAQFCNFLVQRSQLDVNACHQAVDKFWNAGKQADKLMIVAFEKGSGSPAGVVLHT